MLYTQVNVILLWHCSATGVALLCPHSCATPESKTCVTAVPTQVWHRSATGVAQECNWCDTAVHKQVCHWCAKREYITHLLWHKTNKYNVPCDITFGLSFFSP